MKKTDTIHFMLAMVLISMVSLNAEAQRRRDNNTQQNHYDDRDGRDRGRDNDDHRDRNNNHDKYSYDSHDRYDRSNDRHRHNEVRHVHHNHRPTVVHHYHAGRPRYVYFRDYDVYYDCQRNTYISYSGRGWTVTRVAPFAMRNVNIRSARSYEVDYYDDDFPSYLQRRRPSCGQQYRGW